MCFSFIHSFRKKEKIQNPIIIIQKENIQNPIIQIKVIPENKNLYVNTRTYSVSTNLLDLDPIDLTRNNWIACYNCNYKINLNIYINKSIKCDQCRIIIFKFICFDCNNIIYKTTPILSPLWKCAQCNGVKLRNSVVAHNPSIYL